MKAGHLIAGLAAIVSVLSLVRPSEAAHMRPWRKASNALLVDAYEMNIIDWDALSNDKRIAGFIAKASDGLPPSFSCADLRDEIAIRHCRTKWRKYAVSRELYRTRKTLAKSRGLLWGAYHVGRPGDPIDQANHFLDFAQPGADDLMVLDIENADDENYISLGDAEIFVRHIKARTGRYPILYTNDNTARAIAARAQDYPVLSRLPLWYARYKPSIADVFPMGNWPSYAIWQFSAMYNCNDRHCPYRVPGTLDDIDVNVVPMTKARLAELWPFGDLLPARQKTGGEDTALSAGTDPAVTGAVSQAATRLPLPHPGQQAAVPPAAAVACADRGC